MFNKIFAPGANSFLANVALLVLRVWLGATILLNHGLGKLTGFGKLSGGFPDPFGIGHTASLALVVFAEFFAAGLLVFGLVSRFAALVLSVNLAVAFVYAHKGALSGSHSGELPFIYLAGFFTLLIAGGGAFSVDKALFKSGGSKG
ncbi:MAG: DoxX family protein [Limisphaerales bacterium]